jgi:hypothetical protein
MAMDVVRIRVVVLALLAGFTLFFAAKSIEDDIKRQGAEDAEQQSRSLADLEVRRLIAQYGASAAWRTELPKKVPSDPTIADDLRGALVREDKPTWLLTGFIMDVQTEQPTQTDPPDVSLSDSTQTQAAPPKSFVILRVPLTMTMYFKARLEIPEDTRARIMTQPRDAWPIQRVAAAAVIADFTAETEPPIGKGPRYMGMASGTSAEVVLLGAGH